MMVSNVLAEEIQSNLTELELLCWEEALRFKDVPGELHCKVKFDSVTCWPATPAGSLATMPCPRAGVTDHSQNGTLQCQLNGTWEGVANYSDCLLPEEKTLSWVPPQDEDKIRLVYMVGFGISTLVLLLALAIFLYFRSLRCLRNVIHCHLIVSFSAKNLMYFLGQVVINKYHETQYSYLCKAKVVIINYFMCTNFFWMFVEGMYLFSMVVWAFSASKIKHWHYILVGWVSPVLFTAVWAITKAMYDDTKCWLPLSTSHYDYIIHGPVIIALVCNLFFLATIVWVLVTKLRASNSLETQQYRKAARAIAVLFPLLGLTYLLLFYAPKEGRYFLAFKYINAILQSAQGLLVAFFYCFLNGEVQTLLRKKLSSIQDSRGLFARNTKSSFIGSPARSSFIALSMTSCNGRQNNRTREKRCHSETTAVVYPPEEDEAENML